MEKKVKNHCSKMNEQVEGKVWYLNSAQKNDSFFSNDFHFVLKNFDLAGLSHLSHFFKEQVVKTLTFFLKHDIYSNLDAWILRHDEKCSIKPDLLACHKIQYGCKTGCAKQVLQINVVLHYWCNRVISGGINVEAHFWCHYACCKIHNRFLKHNVSLL